MVEPRSDDALAKHVLAVEQFGGAAKFFQVTCVLMLLADNVANKSPEYICEKFPAVDETDPYFAWQRLDFDHQRRVVRYWQEWHLDVETPLKLTDGEAVAYLSMAMIMSEYKRKHEGEQHVDEPTAGGQ